MTTELSQKRGEAGEPQGGTLAAHVRARENEATSWLGTGALLANGEVIRDELSACPAAEERVAHIPHIEDGLRPVRVVHEFSGAHGLPVRALRGLGESAERIELCQPRYRQTPHCVSAIEHATHVRTGTPLYGLDCLLRIIEPVQLMLQFDCAVAPARLRLSLQLVAWRHLADGKVCGHLQVVYVALVPLQRTSARKLEPRAV